MIVVAGDYGQLGNRLIVFANMIACAREHGLRVVNPAFHEYAPCFEATRADVWCRYPANGNHHTANPRLGKKIHRGIHTLQRYARKFHNRTGHWPPRVRVLDIGWRGACDLDSPEFVGLARQPGVLIAKGWLFRAYTSFERHAEAIRELFIPIAEHRENVERTVAPLRDQADIVVGVHIRHGDYRNFLGGQFFFTLDQYADLMRAVRAQFPDRRIAFLVCSDVPQPATAFGDLPVTFGPGHLVEDLYSLAACDYLIGPPSTYTLWASFYGEVPLRIVADPTLPFDTHDFEIVRSFPHSTRTFAADPTAAHAAI